MTRQNCYLFFTSRKRHNCLHLFCTSRKRKRRTNNAIVKMMSFILYEPEASVDNVIYQLTILEVKRYLDKRRLFCPQKVSLS